MKLADKNLKKAECCEEAYKRLASNGMCLMFPVSMEGKTNRPDIDTPYHLSIKVFDVDKDKSEEVENIASKLKLDVPDPKNIKLEFATIKGREGHVYHSINLIGSEIDKISKHFDNFSHMGFDEHKEFHPHIVVDKNTWDNLKNKNLKTAEEADIKFFPAELRNGDKILSKYKSQEEKINKSEKFLEISKGGTKMKLSPEDILTMQDIGTISKNPVRLLRTKGGYWIAFGRKKGSVKDEPLGAGSHSAIVKFNLEKQYPEFEPFLTKSENGLEPIVEKHSHFLSEELKKGGYDVYSIQTGNDIEFQITKNNLKVSEVNGKIDVDYLCLNNLNIPKQFTKALAGATVEKAVNCNVGLKIKE